MIGRIMPRIASRQQRLTMIYGICCLVLILVIMQLWLLTATMNAWLGGDHAVVWPAAFVSLGCFAINLLLLRLLYRVG
ncbi:MAG: DUF6755 family protein [Planctomycetota bacterium]